MSEDSSTDGAIRHPHSGEDVHVTNSSPPENSDNASSSTDSIRINRSINKHPYSNSLPRGSIATSFGYCVKSPATRLYSVSPSPSSGSLSDSEEVLMAMDDLATEYPSRVGTPDGDTGYDSETSTTHHVHALAPLEYPFKAAEFITNPEFPYGVHTPERGTPEPMSTPLDTEDIANQIDRSG